MNFSQFFQILYARKWVGLGVLLLIVGITAVVNLVLPEEYTAKTQLLVDSKSKDPVTGQVLPSLAFPGYLATQIEIIKSRNVAARVVRELGLDKNPLVQQDFRNATDGQGDIVEWMAARILPALEVDLSRDTNVIELAYSGSDPRFASALANAFAKAYLETTLELKLTPARETAEWFDKQITQMRAELDEAQSKLTAYQRDNNIVEFEERLDVESRRLSDVAGQIVAAQSASFDATSRVGGGESIPEVFNSPVAQTLKIQIAQGDARMADLAKRLGENHPDYQRALAEMETLRAKLAGELRSASRSVGATATAANQRFGKLESAFAQQKEKVLSLKEQREEAQVLARNLGNAQRIYDAALQRYGQSRMESQANQVEVVVLNPAVAPIDPSKPRLQLNLLIAVFIGTILAAMSALGAELLDRRVRSQRDLKNLLDLNVLGDAAEAGFGQRLLGLPKRLALARK